MDLSIFINSSKIQISMGDILLIDNEYYLMQSTSIPDYNSIVSLLEEHKESITDEYLLCILDDEDIDDRDRAEKLLHYKGYKYPLLHIDDEILFLPKDDNSWNISLEQYIDLFTQIKCTYGAIIRTGRKDLHHGHYISPDHEYDEQEIDIIRLSNFNPSDVTLTFKYFIHVKKRGKIDWDSVSISGFSHDDFNKGENYKKEIRNEYGCTQVEERSTFIAHVIEHR